MSKEDQGQVFFPKKFAKKLEGSGFMEEAESLDTAGLKQKILESEGVIVETDRAMDADAKLLQLKEDLKALSGGYRDTKAFQTAKIKYCLFLLESRGASLSPDQE